MADEVYELSCCVGTEAIGSCMSGQRKPQRVNAPAARNKEKGADASNTSGLRIGALIRASGSAMVRCWSEAIACFLVKLLQSCAAVAGLGLANPWQWLPRANPRRSSLFLAP